MKERPLDWPGNGIKYSPPQPELPKNLTVGQCIEILSKLDKDADAMVSLEDMKMWVCRILKV